MGDVAMGKIGDLDTVNIMFVYIPWRECINGL
jgi:hypothetical protein